MIKGFIKKLVEFIKEKLKVWPPRMFIICLFLSAELIAQDTLAPPKWIFNGYLKDLNSFTLPKDPVPLQYTQLVHNRMNLKWKPTGNITAAVEVRNRFFWGDAVKNDPEFTDHLRNSSESVNMSVVWFSTPEMVLQTNVERLWVESRGKKWTTRIGRQRINWGMANVWNPNDIFNSYNILDWDYEERPGADAVKVQYMPNELSSFEGAVSMGRNSSKVIASLKYWMNRERVDWQFLTGIYNRKFTAGMGWSSNLGKAGFKGEAQMFAMGGDTGMVVNVTTEIDYITEKGWYLHGAFLYNMQGAKGEVNDWSKLSFQNTPDNLMPTRYNFLAGTTKAFTPLFTGTFTVIFAPFTNMLIIFPSLTYNVSPNIDIDLVWQSFYAESNEKFSNLAQVGYLRLKWSF